MGTPSEHTRSKGLDRRFPRAIPNRVRATPIKGAKNSIKKPKHHHPAKPSTEICRLYLQGTCSGDCYHAHPPICRDYLRGKCTRKCKYAHLTDPALFEHHLHLLDIEKEEKESAARKAKKEAEMTD